jgi:CheY-like chemotaxis protein
MQLVPPTPVTPARTFLVVDDHEDNRYLTHRLLLKAFPGSRVVEAATTVDALAAAQWGRFDGILTDHHLGARDGAAFLQELRTLGVNCPVVMVTSSSDPQVHDRAYKAGAARVFAGADLDFVSYFRSLFTPKVRTPHDGASAGD